MLGMIMNAKNTSQKGQSCSASQKVPVKMAAMKPHRTSRPSLRPPK